MSDVGAASYRYPMSSARRRNILIVLTSAVLLTVAVVGGLGATAWFNGWRPPLWSRFDGQSVGTWSPLSDSTAAVDVDFETGGLTILPAPGLAGANYNGVHSTQPRDFTGRRWALQVDTSHLELSNGLETKFRITKDHKGDYAAVEIGEKSLRFVQTAGGVERDRLIPYDPNAHRWWRIRHTAADDMLHWETSADGRLWIERMRDRRQFDIKAVRIELYAGTFAPAKAPGYVFFSDCRC